MTTNSLRAVEALTMHLGLALHRYGTPAHGLEDAMAQVARRFGVPSHFLSTPTYITASFGAGDDQRVHVARASQGEMNLEKLSLLDDLTHQVVHGEVTAVEAYRQVDLIVNAPRRYGQGLTILAYALASAAVARLFGGGWVEMQVAAASGLCIGAFAALAEDLPTLGRIFDISAAVISAVVAAAAAPFVGSFAIHTATLAGVIILVPGMPLTTAMTELATGNLVSGTARLVGSGMTFMKLGFGAALGTRLGATWLAAGALEMPSSAPVWTLGPALAVASVALAVILHAHPRDLPWIVLNSVVGHVGSRLGVMWVGAELGPFIAALAVTLASNAHARAFDRAATVTQVPAILLLVPGSVGYRSIVDLMANNVVAGMQTAFTMALTAMALVAGILLANLLLPPRKVRRDLR